MGFPSSKLVAQESASSPEVVLHGCQGNVEQLGDLVHVPPAVEAQGNNLVLPRVKGRELFESLFQVQELDPLPVEVQEVVQGNPFPTSAADLRGLFPGVLPQE